MDGEWEPPMIDNPEYKGEWKARQIDNPEYNAEDAKALGKYDEICKIGFDLWQVKSGTIFDNVLITDDVAEAKRIGDETWGATKDPEKAMKDEQDEVEKKKAEEEAAAAGAGDEDEELDDEDLDDIDDEEDELPKEEHDEL
jgi:calreticulin